MGVVGDAPFQRGDVVWHEAPFKEDGNRRPFLILSDSSRPFHGEEYTVVALTSSPKRETIPIDSSDWRYGEMDDQSHASPWFTFTIKHDEIVLPQGSLTDEATDRIAKACAREFGLEL